jgi:hypothetical protein
MSLTTAIRVDFQGALASASDLITGQCNVVTSGLNSFANGVAANQADVIWSDTRSLATGATEDLDLLGGGLLDPFGVAFAPAKVRALYIKAAATNTTNLTIFGDANSVPALNTAATTITLQPGGVFLMTWPALAGIAVGAGATDIIQVVNGAGATAYYNIIVVGTSA